MWGGGYRGWGKEVCGGVIEKRSENATRWEKREWGCNQKPFSRYQKPAKEPERY
jgi:hypothetical protein